MAQKRYINAVAHSSNSKHQRAHKKRLTQDIINNNDNVKLIFDIQAIRHIILNFLPISVANFRSLICFGNDIYFKNRLYINKKTILQIERKKIELKIDFDLYTFISFWIIFRNVFGVDAFETLISTSLDYMTDEHCDVKFTLRIQLENWQFSVKKKYWTIDFFSGYDMTHLCDEETLKFTRKFNVQIEQIDYVSFDLSPGQECTMLVRKELSYCCRWSFDETFQPYLSSCCIDMNNYQQQLSKFCFNTKNILSSIKTIQVLLSHDVDICLDHNIHSHLKTLILVSDNTCKINLRYGPNTDTFQYLQRTNICLSNLGLKLIWNLPQNFSFTLPQSDIDFIEKCNGKKFHLYYKQYVSEEKGFITQDGIIKIIQENGCCFFKRKNEMEWILCGYLFREFSLPKHTQILTSEIPHLWEIFSIHTKKENPRLTLIIDAFNANLQCFSISANNKMDVQVSLRWKNIPQTMQRFIWKLEHFDLKTIMTLFPYFWNLALKPHELPYKCIKFQFPILTSDIMMQKKLLNTAFDCNENGDISRNIDV